MNSKSQKDKAASLLKVIPAKWAVGIIAALIVYALLQPRLNQWFGWNLPSVDSLTGDEPAKASPKKTAEANPSNVPRSGKSQESNEPPQTVEDFLKEVGKNRFESPVGLLYKPGSEEGHRLKHIERHLKDIPDRPGSHGVFEGSMLEFLIAIDDAVTRAKRKLKGTTMEEDEGAIVYEASFDKPIGFLGGEVGKRKKNPKVKKMRVVIRDDAVITAFPF